MNTFINMVVRLGVWMDKILLRKMTNQINLAKKNLLEFLKLYEQTLEFYDNKYKTITKKFINPTETDPSL